MRRVVFFFLLPALSLRMGKGSVFGQKRYWLYGAAKAAILGMVGNLRHEGKDHGIKVNAILPGAATAMTMSDPTMTAAQVRNGTFCQLFILKMPILSRQARDKHRES